MPPEPRVDPQATAHVIVSFLREYLAGSGARGGVVGLSGGVDSAVVAALAAQAWGAERLLGLILPHATSDPQDAVDAAEVAGALGIAAETVEITPVTDAAQRAVHVPLSGMAQVNLRPRARMMLLYAHANSSGRLVLGTGNKSELMTGYFTKFGDGGADVYPIGDLYKTDVWALARHLRIPARVVDKPPTAGLWAGQRDEEELGMAYADLDRLLEAFEGGLSVEDAAGRTGLPLAGARAIWSRIEASEHKRTSLVIPKLGFRTPGLDWRLPRTRGAPPRQ